jgi:hypothetical protein
MSSESVFHVAHSWVDVGSFHTHLSGVVNVTCSNFHDGSDKGTASVPQILSQSWVKCYGDHIELYAGFSMACPVQDQLHIS